MANEERAEEKELLCPYRAYTINGEYCTSQMFPPCKGERCAAFYNGMCLRAREPLLNYLNRNKGEDRP